MKILLVSQYFYPETFKINDLIFSLKKRGHDITVLTGKPNYSKNTFYDGYGWKSNDFETIFDIPVYRANLFSRGNGGAIRLFLNYISFAIFALFNIKKIRPGVSYGLWKNLSLNSLLGKSKNTKVFLFEIFLNDSNMFKLVSC